MDTDTPHDPSDVDRAHERYGRHRRLIVATPEAPRAIGPYSQGVRAGALVFTAGQIGLDPRSGALAEGVAGETRQALANLAAILAAGGASLGGVVKTTIFLVDMADFDAMNAVYAEHFATDAPARVHSQGATLLKRNSPVRHARWPGRHARSPPTVASGASRRTKPASRVTVCSTSASETTSAAVCNCRLSAFPATCWRSLGGWSVRRAP